MKKVMLILMLGVFAFGSSAFTSIDLSESNDDDCDAIAEVNYNLELMYGHGQMAANLAYVVFYWDCMDNGGSSEYEVTIITN